MKSRVPGRPHVIGVALALATIVMSSLALADRPSDEAKIALVAERTAEPITQSTAEPTTVPTPPLTTCRNSYEPQCGPFRWDPEPVNDPMTVELSYEPSSPEVGEKIEFTATARDDSPSHADISQGKYGNEYAFGSTPSCVAKRDRYGPWTPPRKETRTIVLHHRYAYEEPGTYDVEFEVTTGQCEGYDPYRGSGVGKTTVVVGTKST